MVHGWFARWMRRGKRPWGGFTIPVLFFGAVILYWLDDDQIAPHDWVRLHEREHAKQIALMGALCFTAVYLYNRVRYGYRNNPLEVAARRAAGQD